jgi:chemotaxis protein CheX
MDVRYINPFLSSIRTVFDTMVKVPMSIGKPFIASDDVLRSSTYVVSVLIELTGAVTGQLAMSMTKAVALAMGGAMDAEVTTVEDSRDALGEIANMIAGSAKKDFPGGGVNLSTPRIVDPDQVAFPEDRAVIAIPCDTSKGRFVVEVSLA